MKSKESYVYVLLKRGYGLLGRKRENRQKQDGERR